MQPFHIELSVSEVNETFWNNSASNDETVLAVQVIVPEIGCLRYALGSRIHFVCELWQKFQRHLSPPISFVLIASL